MFYFDSALKVVRMVQGGADFDQAVKAQNCMGADARCIRQLAKILLGKK
jgi:hypothetical protein